jgi:hypothetical protein
MEGEDKNMKLRQKTTNNQTEGSKIICTSNIVLLLSEKLYTPKEFCVSKFCTEEQSFFYLLTCTTAAPHL